MDSGTLDRRQFLGVTGMAAASAIAGRGGPAEEADRPNILLMQTDQHNWNVLGCASNKLARSSNLDGLAEDGVRFSNAVCATPFCSPTRASWLTGQWPHTHGLTTNVHGGEHWLTDERTNLPNILHDAGYKCAHFGKWHLGVATDIRAYNHHTSRRERRKAYNRFMREETDIQPQKLPQPRLGWGHIEMTPHIAAFHDEWKKEENRSPQDLSIIGRSTLAPELQWESWLADRCIDFIEENRDGPFFATYSVSPPHAYWTAPDPFYSMYDPAEMPWPESWGQLPEPYRRSQPARMGRRMAEKGVREYLRCYYAQVTMMDSFMGRIIDRVRELGLWDDTIVIFTSDHGDMQGAHGCIGKSLPAAYDEIMRVPLIIRVPGSRARAISQTPAGSVDLMPTILDYVGMPVPDSVQGVSLRGPVDGTRKDDARPAFTERGQGNRLMRTIRYGTWKYSFFKYRNGGVRKELFDLANDPAEMNNLAGTADLADTEAYLHQRLKKHCQGTDDTAALKALSAGS